MRDLSSLSDYEFELLVADLLGTELGTRFETFARGADGGIDLRRIRSTRKIDVVQCKHYLRSSYTQLRSAARKEAKKLKQLDPPPTTYRFVTSQELTVGRKRELTSILQPWVKRDDHVYGMEDIEALLSRHSSVERRHVKLWLASSEQLQVLLNAGTHTRSKTLVESIRESLPLYVQNDSFYRAQTLLEDRGVCLVAGVPGLGKTVLARMLLAEGAAAGFEPIKVSEDIDEAWDVYREGDPQIFYYDDFLGRTSLGEKLRKNEDRRLVDFMRLAARSRTTRLVLTTREYILHQAVQLYENLALSGVDADRFLLTLEDYSDLDRARIFYNHIYHSEQLGPAAHQALIADRAYMRIVRHPKYNPRIIEFITGLSSKRLSETDLNDYVDFAVNALDHPNQLWTHAFEEELTDHERILLLVLATMPSLTQIDDLESAFRRYCSSADVKCPASAFRRALKVLELTFTMTRRTRGEVFVGFANPSVLDFMVEYLDDNPTEAVLLAEGAEFFDQIETLWGLGTREGATGEAESLKRMLTREAGAVARSLSRVIAAPGADRNVLVYDGSGDGRFMPDDVDLAVRLAFAVELSYAAEDAAVEVRALLENSLEGLIAQWADGKGGLTSAVDFVRTLARRERRDTARFEAVATALKDRIVRGLNDIGGYRELRRLWEAAPEVFSRDEWNTLSNDFFQFATDTLDDAGALVDTLEDIDELEVLMDDWGLLYPDDELEEAREEVASRIAEAEEDFDPDDWREQAEDESSDTQGDQIDLLFARLSDASAAE